MGIEDDSLAEFWALSSPYSAQRCGIASALEELEPAEARKLRIALGHAAVSHAAIVKWLALKDIKRSRGTVARHRHGQCRCDDTV